MNTRSSLTQHVRLIVFVTASDNNGS